MEYKFEKSVDTSEDERFSKSTYDKHLKVSNI